MISFKKGGWNYGNRIDISELGKQIYIQEVIELINKNQFYIIPREKNKNFIYKYKLDYIMIKQMLLSLEKDDIKYQVEDIEYTKYGSAPLVVFKKQFHLIDMFGNDKNEIVYIKIKMNKEKMPVISFHLNE